MKTQGITLEQLAQKIGKSVWSKNGLSRIYLNDAGYNTRKMSTKAFIYEKDGEFLVSCHIECPSQPLAWIRKQEEEVRNQVYSDIAEAIQRILDPSIEQREAEEAAKAAAEWEAGREERERIEAERREREAKEEEERKKEEAERAEAILKAGGQKYRHPKYGIGVVGEEDENTITLAFEGIGVKKFLKNLVKLTKVE